MKTIEVILVVKGITENREEEEQERVYKKNIDKTILLVVPLREE